MKEFFRIMAKDYLKEDFTRRELVIYGIVAPLVMIAGCLFTSFIEQL